MLNFINKPSEHSSITILLRIQLWLSISIAQLCCLLKIALLIYKMHLTTHDFLVNYTKKSIRAIQKFTYTILYLSHAVYYTILPRSKGVKSTYFHGAPTFLV